MGQSTHLVGFKPADSHYKKMFRVLESCREVGVDPPERVKSFFGPNWEEADEKGVRVPFFPKSIGESGVYEWNDGDTQWGIEVDLRKLDPDVKILRFYNSI